jgi:hypothetical protein
MPVMMGRFPLKRLEQRPADPAKRVNTAQLNTAGAQFGALRACRPSYRYSIHAMGRVADFMDSTGS